MTMTLKVLILGALQGATEILPISSSGHLVLGRTILGLDTPGATLEVVLHVGTLVAVMAYYRRVIGSLIARLSRGEPEAWQQLSLIAIGCLPAAMAGGLFVARIEAAFASPRVVAVLLMVTGVWLLTVPRARGQGMPVTPPRALWIGLAQVAALLPGISRSGATIGMARHLGVDGDRAAEFSFLMSVPLVAGAAVLHAVHGGLEARALEVPWFALLGGAAVAAAAGYAAIALLVRVLQSPRFWLLGVYCLAIGTASLAVLR
jgi:undecaprenyl-diphosphatase